MTREFTLLLLAVSINSSAPRAATALKAFRQWRFRVGGASRVNLAIRFTMSTGMSYPAKSDLSYAVYAPRTTCPADGRAKGWAGTGIVLVDVDLKSGQVTAARMLQSTAYRVLDEAALNAFRQWRFKPSTVSHVRIPIRFLTQGVVPVEIGRASCR